MSGLTSACAWFLALRYLLTRWVNFVGVIGIALAVWALIVVPAVFTGFISEIRNHIRGTTADLVVSGLGKDRSYHQLRTILEADRQVVSTAPRLNHDALIFPQGRGHRVLSAVDPVEAGSGAEQYFRLIGMDPERERQTTRFTDWLAPSRPQTEWVESSAEPFTVSRNRALIARRVLRIPTREEDFLKPESGLILPSRSVSARTGSFLPGQPVELVTIRILQDESESKRLVTIRRIRPVSGGFQTRHRLFDDEKALMHIDDLRAILGQPQDDERSIDIVSEVAVRVTEDADPLSVSRRLEQALAAHGGGTVRTWQQVPTNARFLGAVHQERGMMTIVLFAVMLVACFLVYATIHMMVSQKTKDIGVLSALGAPPQTIAAIFLLSGFVIAALGSGLGVLIGLVSAWRLNDVNDWFKEMFGYELFPTGIYALARVPVLIETQWVIKVVATAFALALLVALWQARRAARLDPVKALSYE